VNKRLLAVTIPLALFLTGQPQEAAAVPMLQLDIAGGSYDTTTQTIVSGGTTFSLFALGTHDDVSRLLGRTFYISAAILPASPDANDLGYFSVNGQQVNATADMTYGTPPTEQFAELQGADPGDLAPHGVYPAWFREFEFTFSPSDRTTTYDSALNPGGINPSSIGKTFFHEFLIDTSHLNPNYVVHFDLYSAKLRNCATPERRLYPGADCVDTDIKEFAPFSHDAESSPPVPEPASILLFGSGLAAAGVRKYRQRRAQRTE
jgi:hypothetical protein